MGREMACFSPFDFSFCRTVHLKIRYHAIKSPLDGLLVSKRTDLQASVVTAFEECKHYMPVEALFNLTGSKGHSTSY